VAALGLTAFAPAIAQDRYSSKPIRWIVGFPVGGGSDFLAHTIAAAMSE